ncbi:MAG: cytochrome b5-like heme/steroid binding domain-containing protein [Candidatus Uhrbacteria bacterium]
MNKNLKLGFISAFALLALAGAGCGTTEEKEKPEAPAAPINSAPVVEDTGLEYSFADVKGHSSSTACWTAVNGSVYDVTKWISQHPGGEKAILGLCGNDGSAAYDKKHGGQARPESELANFKIGTLKTE